MTHQTVPNHQIVRKTQTRVRDHPQFFKENLRYEGWDRRFPFIEKDELRYFYNYHKTMLALRTFLQHWQHELDGAELQRLKLMCRETVEVCRAAENQYYLGRLDEHMSSFAPTFWRVARDYFEGDEHLHFKFQEGIPFSNVSIYTSLGREDLDFLRDFEDYRYLDKRIYYKGIILMLLDIPGLSKEICIYFNRKRCGAMFREERTNVNLMLIPQDEDEYNLALEMIVEYRKNILSINIDHVYDLPAHRPYRALKIAIRSMNYRSGPWDSIEALIDHAGNDEDWSDSDSE